MSKRKSEDSSHKAKLTKRTNSQEQPEQEIFEQDGEALLSVRGLLGSQDNDYSLTEVTRISRGSSASSGEEAKEVVSESDVKQSTSKMSIRVTRSDRGSSASQGEEAKEVTSESDVKQSTFEMSIGVTRSDRGSSASQGEGAMEVVSKSDIKQSTSKMPIRVTRSDRRRSASQGKEAMEVVSESDKKQSTSKMPIRVTRSDRECCEHHLICKKKLVITKNKDEKTTGGDAGTEEFSTNEDILKTCNALLNSGGGLLEIKLSKPQNNSGSKEESVDSYWKKIESTLRDMIYPTSYIDVFDRLVLPNQIQLFVNAPDHFCTKRYNLYEVSDASVLPASFLKVEEILKQKPQDSERGTDSNVQFALKDLPEIPENFCLNEKFNLTESTQIQYKNFTSHHYFLENFAHKEKIRKQLSAFGNCYGGVILLGVKDNQVVSGVDLAETSKDDVVEKVRSQVNKVCCNFKPVRGVHWDVAFSTVTGSGSRSVIVIKMAGIKDSGGIFGKCPESYELGRDKDGRHVARCLKFPEWKKRMDSDGPWWQDNSKNVCFHQYTSSKGMTEVISKFEGMRISKGPLLTIKDDVKRIKDSFFIVDENFSISPKGAVDNLPKAAQVVIRQIQMVCRRDLNCGILVVSRSWSRGTQGKAIDGVICDVLVVSENMGGLHLYTLCDTEDRTHQHYSKKAAQEIKRSLHDHGARGQKFYVSFHVVSCCERVEVKLPSRDHCFPKSYDLASSSKKLDVILEAMVISLTAVPSTLCSKVGVTILNLLTEEQFQLVFEKINITRKLWVKGFAGTGKTLVAIEIMKRVQQLGNLEGHEILYVCENEGIANQVRRSCSCNVVCRKTFLGYEFPDVKHVIMDEVHNYEQPPGTESWYKKAKRLVRQHDPSRPGYLWFFIDLCQKSHLFPSGIPEDGKQEPQFRLYKVIRNSGNIFNSANKWLGENGSNVEIGHDFIGEEVREISYSPAETSQTEVLKENLQKLLEEGYSHGDIAVLFLKGDEIPSDQELSFALNDSPWTSAVQNHSEKIVISSVLKYSGLDRPVVVLVDLYQPLYKRQLEPFLYGAMTRAMVKLVIIYCKN